MDETWVDIEGYPNYMLNNKGEVLSLFTERLLKPRYTARDNLYHVMLYNEDGPRDFYIHHLVAMCFFDGYRPGMHVVHMNGDTSDNTTMNIRLKGRRDPNMAVHHPKHEVWGKRIRIVETGEIFRTVRDCANYIGGDYSSIYRVIRGERRHHMGYTFEFHEDDDNTWRG